MARSAKIVTATCVGLPLLLGSLLWAVCRQPSLHRAAQSGDGTEIARLLARGHDPDRRSSVCMTVLFGRWTPLMWAVHEAHRSAAEVLLANGADANASDAMGFSVLWIAVCPRGQRWTERGRNWSERAECSELLLAHGADPNMRMPDGSTALHQAVLSRSPALVSALLRNGALVDALDRDGCTPLLHSLQCQPDAEVTRLLLHHGASVIPRRREQLSVVEWVQRNASRLDAAVVEMILAAERLEFQR